jgi:heme o synthase
MKPAEAGVRGPLAVGLPATHQTARSRTAVLARAADYVALTKPRLNSLVIATAAAGYHLAGGSPDVSRLVTAVAGTALVAGGAAALNQVYERETDALMVRTRTRPVPDGRVGAAEATIFGAILAAAGLALLVLGSNLLAAAVAWVTLVSYLGVYTPLKLRTPLATIVGAVPGALPPVIGWAAATGHLPVEAWTLFAIVFLWQMPHFLAIAWMLRDDYRLAGFPLLPIVEPDGRSTGRQALIYAVVLSPVSLLPTVLGLAGRWYFGGAMVLGLGFIVLAARFAADRTTPRARALFLGSITYLPLIWVLMIADRVRP